MAISFSQYVKITSALGGVQLVNQRQLILRLMTQNVLLPTQSYIEFTSATQVGAYFGTTSEEYLRASFYFSWVNKLGTSPQKISFGRWNSSVSGSQIYGVSGTYATSQFTSITTGDFTLTLGGFTYHLTGLNFSACGSLAAVAAVIQTAVRAYSAGGAAWTAATVAYNSTLQAFTLVSGATGTDTVALLAGSVVDVTAPLGWGAGVILSNGAAAETLTQTMTNTVAASNNFGTFIFIGNSSFTTSQVTELSVWNNGQNGFYAYLQFVSAANAATIQTAVSGYAGVALVLGITGSGQYHEMFPALVLAATNYNNLNSVQNYMFQLFPTLTPTVTTDAAKATYDALSVNYIGQTQNAGNFIAFSQNGYLQGGATNITDMSDYFNEMWLKSAATASLGSLLLGLANLPANLQGTSLATTAFLSVINAAISNGTISIGNVISSTQQAYITQQTGDPNAWLRVKNLGYWFTITFQPYTMTNGNQGWQLVYTLIYAKNNAVRMIVGTDILI